MCRKAIFYVPAIIFLVALQHAAIAKESSCGAEKTTKDAISCLENLIATISNQLETEKTKKTKFPKGLVAAFESVNCPVGWSGYKDAEGRFLIGTGQNGDLSRRALGEIGGLEKIVLSKSQMPRHQHNTPQAMDDTGPNFGLGPRRLSVHGANWAQASTELTSNEGANSSIVITPPFVSLKFCIKQ
jgi:hypothetical protein